MAAKAKKDEVARFEGSGQSYKAKLIGVEAVPEARGDQMCQESITKLKREVKLSGQHKQKIMVNVTLEGLKIIDAVSFDANKNKKKAKPNKDIEEADSAFEDSSDELDVLHTHAVHKISFISRDSTDSRAFGYIYGDEDGQHKFFAIKTGAAAEQLVLALRDLFQVVYELKKKEVDEAKDKLGEVSVAGEGNAQTSRNGSTSGTGQTTQNQNADDDNVYQVPTNNAPVDSAQVANLLDLEDQAENILKSIEQVKNLDFSEEEKPSSPVASPPTSPLATLAPPAAGNAATSALNDLSGLQAGPPAGFFPGFAPPAYPGQPGFGQMVGGMPVAADPFANDPFRTGAASAFGAPGFGMQQRPGVPGAMQMPGMMPGMVQPGMMGMPQQGMPQQGMPQGMPQGVPQIVMNPFGGVPQQPQAQNAFGAANKAPEPNLLVPLREGVQEDEPKPIERSKSPRDDLFGELVDIKKDPAAAPAATPKDLFAQANAVEKKTMNQLMSEQVSGDVNPQGAAPFNTAFPASKEGSLFD